MISTDQNIFKKESAVRARMIEYGELFDRLDIIIHSSLKTDPENISEKVTIYSTNSLTRFNYVRDAVKLGRTFKNVDIVAAQDPFETGLDAKKIVDKNSAKLHLPIHTDFANPYFKNSVLNRIRLGIVKKILPKADSVRVVSRRIKESLSSLKLKTDPVILPIFVDSEKFLNTQAKFNLREKYPQFEIIILTVARLEQEKNIFFELEVLAELVKEYPRLGLVIVGQGRLEKTLKSKALKLGLKDNIIFEGETNDVISYYKGADIYFQTSRYEGFGLSLFEAALSSLPIISTDVGLVGDILLDEESLFVTNLKKEETVQKLRRLIDNHVLRESLGARAKDSALQFAITKEEYLKRYYEILTS